jgi:hypothetical protein
MIAERKEPLHFRQAVRCQPLMYLTRSGLESERCGIHFSLLGLVDGHSATDANDTMALTDTLLPHLARARFQL